MDFDAAIIGGGIAGSSLANTLARNGARVLVVEREQQFRDRVRGEGMLPWGAGEARRLGIHQPCSMDVPRRRDGGRPLMTTAT